jgi:hypothetical protein
MYPSWPRTDCDVISSAPRVALRSTLGYLIKPRWGKAIRLRIGVDCTMQAIQVVVGYSGWRLPDGFMPQRGARG